MVWMFVFPQNPYVEKLMSKVMLLADGAFGRWLDHMGGNLINGISALIKEDPESCCPISTMWVGNLQPRRGLSQEPDHAGTLTLNLQPLELWKINFCCLLATEFVVGS